MLKAWTIGGARNLTQQDKLRTLDERKLEHNKVFDRNLIETEPESEKQPRVILTVMDGKTVYKK